MQRFFFQMLFFFICSSCFAYEYKLTICAISQDESEFLKEWIEFHRIQGAEHFYIFDNSRFENYQDYLKDYINQNIVTVIDWKPNNPNFNTVQCEAYTTCLKFFGNKSKWMAFLDTDEFLFCKNGKKLPFFLRNYEKFGAVGVNWLMFGTSDVEDIQKNELLIEKLIKCSPKSYSPNTHIKSIVRTKYASHFVCPHACVLKENLCVDENKNPVFQLYFTKEHTSERIVINHYWTRTEKFFWGRKIPRRQKWGHGLQNIIDTKDILNTETNQDIFMFIPLLRYKLF